MHLENELKLWQLYRLVLSLFYTTQPIFLVAARKES